MQKTLYHDEGVYVLIAQSNLLHAGNKKTAMLSMMYELYIVIIKRNDDVIMGHKSV